MATTRSTAKSLLLSNMLWIDHCHLLLCFFRLCYQLRSRFKYLIQYSHISSQNCHSFQLSERVDAGQMENKTLEKQEGGCSAMSFLIKDGVCDEITNTPPCLYDGGDCCLEEKKTKLCQNCSCIVPVTRVELMQLYKANRVKVYSGWKIDKFTELKVVEEVAEKEGCQKLCLDFSLVNNEMDSWKYEVDVNKTCTCMTFNACYDECDPNEIMSLHNHKNLAVTDNVTYFAMMERFLPCGR